jgi:GxxExxY protein
VPDHVREGYFLSALTGRIIKAARAVHQGLGPGFEEVIYRRALAIEFATCGRQFSREVWIVVRYRGEKVGRQRVDFIAGEDAGDRLVETKAKAALGVIDFVHTLSYLKIWSASCAPARLRCQAAGHCRVSQTHTAPLSREVVPPYRHNSGKLLFQIAVPSAYVG